MEKIVYAIATMDTKGAEAAFLADRLRSAGVPTRTVDVGTLDPPTVAADIARQRILSLVDDDQPAPASADRAVAIAQMAGGLTNFLVGEQAAGRLAGVIGIGGGGGTSLITTAMRALPIGCPKLMVSTMASGDVSPYIDCSDITMVYSVVDIAGLNVVSQTVLANAAAAMNGMVNRLPIATESRPAVGMTMFGVTTPCVTRVRQQIEAAGFDALVFHATGSGGRAMERLVQSGLIGGVLDVTTTEVADEVVGGVLPCGPQRFDRLLASRIPLVISLGAVDMVNFGGIDSVPERFRNRRLHVHNAEVTLMRTNVEENIRIARWITDKLNRSTAPLTVVVPTGGLSLLDVPGQPFHDPEADAALFETLEAELQPTAARRLIRLPEAINDPGFADALVREFFSLSGTKGSNR